MVNEEVVRNTIQKMREAGLSENIIASTLQDLGLSPAQMQSYLAPNSANSRPPAPNVSIPNSPPRKEEDDDENAFSDLDHEVLATRTSEKVMQRMDERNLLNEQTDSLKDNITHIALEQHGQQLQDTHNAVVELHDKLDSANLETMSNRLSTVNARMDQLQKDVSDAKALMGAVQSLLQKVLETNQQLLFETKNRR
jgi:DNA-binding transcriptional MerR regulator